ncbi:MAG: ATP-binding protein [Halioglobus sp.]
MSTNKSELAFQVHDLRSKVSAGLSFVELLEHERPDIADSPMLDSVRECLESVIETSRQISLEVSQSDSVDTADASNNLLVVSARDVVSKHAAEAYAALGKQFPIEIVYSSESLDDDKYVAMDPIEIRSIRENVIANAAAAGASRLNVTYSMKSYGLLIVMEDNGCGMDADKLNLLRLRRLGDGQVHGLGTRRIQSAARDNESVITYSSEVGRGTTVQILCPYVEPAVS